MTLPAPFKWLASFYKCSPKRILKKCIEWWIAENEKEDLRPLSQIKRPFSDYE